MHNSAKYIGAALDSLLTQTLPDLEVIAVDDGSTDTTTDIVRGYADRDERVRLIQRSRPSGRPAVPRNDGLRAARGEYIAFLDADDLAVPTRFESTIEAIVAADATLAFTDMIRFDNLLGVVDRETRLQRAHFLERAAPYLKAVTDDIYLCAPNFIGFMLADIPAISTQTVLFSRSLLSVEQLWFDESWTCAEDTDLFLRLAARARIVFLNQTQTLYRVHGESLTARQPEHTTLEGIAVRQANLKRFRTRLSDDEIDAAYRRIALSLSDIAYDRWCRGDRREARTAYIESWQTARSSASAIGYFKTFVSRQLVGGMVEIFRTKGRST